MEIEAIGRVRIRATFSNTIEASREGRQASWTAWLGDCVFHVEGDSKPRARRPATQILAAASAHFSEIFKQQGAVRAGRIGLGKTADSLT